MCWDERATDCQSASGDVVSASCGGNIPSPTPFQTRVGRLFNLNRDVMVSLAPLITAGSGCGGNPNMAFYILDQQDAPKIVS